MRLPRMTTRRWMTAVAFLALALAVAVLSVRLQQALVREQRLRAEAEFHRAQVERNEYARRLAAAQAEWQRQGPIAAPKP